jgi:hypothetical protein
LPGEGNFFVSTKGIKYLSNNFLGSILNFNGTLWLNADNSEYNPEIEGLMGWDIGRGVWGYKSFWIWATGMGK